MHIIVGMEAGHLGFALWENLLGPSVACVCVSACVYSLVCSSVLCAKGIVFKGKFQLLFFIILAIITINNNNVVLTNLIADICEHGNTVKKGSLTRH